MYQLVLYFILPTRSSPSNSHSHSSTLRYLFASLLSLISFPLTFPLLSLHLRLCVVCCVLYVVLCVVCYMLCCVLCVLGEGDSSSRQEQQLPSRLPKTFRCDAPWSPADARSSGMREKGRDWCHVMLTILQMSFLSNSNGSEKTNCFWGSVHLRYCIVLLFAFCFYHTV